MTEAAIDSSPSRGDDMRRTYAELPDALFVEVADRGKAPIGKWTDPANQLTVEKAAGLLDRCPARNVGMPMGGQRKLVALDVDGPEGERNLAALIIELGPLPPTLEARSGRAEGGRHLIFRAYRSVAIANKELADKIDVKAQGGQIVVAPSVHASGAVYAWNVTPTPEAIANLPPRWVAALPYKDGDGPGGSEPLPSPPAAVARAVTRPSVTAADRVRRGRAMGILRAGCDEISGTPKSKRHEMVRDKSYQLAGELIAHGHLDRETVRAAVIAAMRSAGYEVHKHLPTLDSGLDKGIRKPWRDPLATDRPRSSSPPSGAPRAAEDGVDEEREAIQNEPPRDAEPWDRWQRATDIIDGLGTSGPPIPTGIAPLDRICRGGPRVGKLIICLGAPSSMKTGITAELASSFARRGIPALYLAADEPAEAVSIRWGQHIGIDRDDLENGKVVAKRNTRDHIASIPLELVDGDEDGATIENVARRIRSLWPDGPAVLVVDSVQKARANGSADADSLRAAVEAVVAALKAAAKKYGLLVIATSEVSRAVYRSKRDSENASGLAGGKESGGIEYAADLLLSFRSQKGGRVRVEVEKNRLSPIKDPFGLAMDPQRATFAPYAIEPDGEDSDEPSTIAVRTERLLTDILALITEKPGQVSASRAQLALGVGKGKILTAFAALKEGGKIENRGSKDSPSWFPV